jgi:acetate kinase
MTSETQNTLLVKGLVDRIGLPEGVMTHKPQDGRAPYEYRGAIPNHTEGIRLIIEALTNAEHGVITSLDQLNAVGHRVAHGGEYFSTSALVDAEVIEKIRSCFELAPLHNPANLEGVLSIQSLLPTIPQVAVFDTSFHQTIPAENYLYALPYEYYEKYRVRKYGFHGTSHKFVARRGAEFAGLDINNSKIITCHVGNGGSITAVLNGKSFDTSMGFTPLDGLVMGTRCGAVDAGAVLYIGEKEGLDYAALNTVLNKKSGIEALTGVSSDMRDVDDAFDAGNPRAIVGRNLYYSKIAGFVGAYAAEMNGVDMVIFTGGVGENSNDLRRYVCDRLGFLGVQYDSELNDKTRGTDTMLSTPESKVKVAVIATNEELVIATDTFNLVK